jgi:hypothetical protein
MLDIEAIINRHLADSKMEGKTFHEGHIAIDLHNAIEEINRLRAEVDTEREAVVAWLRDLEDAWHMPMWQLADAIERGEHRSEEKE